LIFKSKKLDNYTYGENPDLEAHAKITRQSAAEGIVLLKNEDALPLRDSRNIALLGVTSYDFIAGGTGSGDVNEAYTVSLEEGLGNQGLQTTESQAFEINEVARQIYDDHRAANPDEFVKPEGMDAMFNPYTPPQVTYSEEQLREIESTSDVAIITIGRNSGEGGDRVVADDFLLTNAEKEMISMVSEVFHAAGKKVVVVLNIGGVVETASWKGQVDAILLAWQGGQEGGNSVADILSGQVNPSGKLPMTFPVRVEDHASHANFPLLGEPMNITSMLFNSEKKEEEKVKNTDYTLYEEGIYVGYRHFDKSGLSVSYPFGYGLSYTTFDLDSITATVANDTVLVTLSVQNTGEVAGKEVVQIYAGKPEASVDRPVQELEAFTKTPMLAPGESYQVTLAFPVSELSYWDEENAGWVLENGIYEIRAGASSRDIRQQAEIEL
jgi:beta-glucosidase